LGPEPDARPAVGLGAQGAKIHHFLLEVLKRVSLRARRNLEHRPEVGHGLDHKIAGDRQFGGPLGEPNGRDRVAERVLHPGHVGVRAASHAVLQDLDLRATPRPQYQSMGIEADRSSISLRGGAYDPQQHPLARGRTPQDSARSMCM
jgi:hypothetical protein